MCFPQDCEWLKYLPRKRYILSPTIIRLKTMADNKKEQERSELQSKIWSVAEDVLRREIDVIVAEIEGKL